jgi:hypothetical protein
VVHFHKQLEKRKTAVRWDRRDQHHQSTGGSESKCVDQFVIYPNPKQLVSTEVEVAPCLSWQASKTSDLTVPVTSSFAPIDLLVVAAGLLGAIDTCAICQKQRQPIADRHLPISLTSHPEAALPAAGVRARTRRNSSRPTSRFEPDDGRSRLFHFAVREYGQVKGVTYIPP